MYICNALTPQINGYICYVYLFTGRHLNVHQCTSKYVSRESGYTSKRASHFHQRKHGLDVDEVVCLFYTSSDRNRLWEINIYSRDDCYKLKCCHKKHSNEGVSVSLLFYKLGNFTVRTSLTVHSQVFQHVFECGHAHITDDTS